MHHRRSAFEEAPAPGDEERIAGEGRAIVAPLVEHERDRAAGVAGHVERAERQPGGGEARAVRERVGERRDPIAVALEAEHREAGAHAREIRRAADVVPVMVREQDRAEGRLLARERGLDRRGLRRVDHDGDRGVLAEHEIGVVVAETGNRNDAHRTTSVGKPRTEPRRRHARASARARMASNIGGVSRPVCVLCWLTW